MAGDTPIEAKAAVRFAGLVVDVDACTLARDSGEHIALTRSEFALLRAFVGRPGRVISRETLLEATANRRFEPFDRSIDILISRLRRKIEPDPKQPRLIVTVPGEGYRFDGLKPAVLATPSAEERAADLPIETSSPLPAAIDHASRIAAKPSWRFRLSDMLAALSLVLLLALLGFVPHTPASGPIPTALPGVVILPFANLTGDAGNDYLGRALAFEVATTLGGYPGLRVVSAPASTNDPSIDVGHASGARYVVHGGLQRLRDLLRVSVTL